jgi:hypothetical protein
MIQISEIYAAMQLRYDYHSARSVAGEHLDALHLGGREQLSAEDVRALADRLAGLEDATLVHTINALREIAGPATPAKPASPAAPVEAHAPVSPPPPVEAKPVAPPSPAPVDVKPTPPAPAAEANPQAPPAPPAPPAAKLPPLPLSGLKVAAPPPEARPAASTAQSQEPEPATVTPAKRTVRRTTKTTK